MQEEQFNACIQSILAGDKSGLRQIYDAYLPYIYQIVLGIVGTKENAEDITSEFFIKLWQNAGKYKPGSGHKGYMATIARNMAIDFLRKYKKEQLESFTTENDEDAPTTEYDSGVNIENEVIEDISVEEALNSLNEVERIIVDMKVLSEMTFKEISEVLKIPMGTITWRYNEAIKKLRRYGYDEKS